MPITFRGTRQVKKLGRTQDSYFEGVDPWLRGALAEFNTMPFLDFLERLTGISGLIPDPHFRGGAFHQILPGGHLDMHVDFNVDRRRNLLRRVNAFFYLNKAWRSEYGGSLSGAAPRRQRRYRPHPADIQSLRDLQHRFVISSRPPRALERAPGVTRKSMGLYYYTSDPTAFGQNVPHITIWQPS